MGCIRGVYYHNDKILCFLPCIFHKNITNLITLHFYSTIMFAWSSSNKCSSSDSNELERVCANWVSGYQNPTSGDKIIVTQSRPNIGKSIPKSTLKCTPEGKGLTVCLVLWGAPGRTQQHHDWHETPLRADRTRALSALRSTPRPSGDRNYIRGVSPFI